MTNALTFADFERLLRFVQRPLEVRPDGSKTHSTAQRDGWEALFRTIDADQTGVLTQPELARYLQRQKRSVAAALEEEGEQRQAATSFKQRAAGAAAAEVVLAIDGYSIP